MKKCHGGRVHDDALALVEYLLANGGKVAKTNEAIALDLRMVKNLGGGHMIVDAGRLTTARRHIQDVETLCCAYMLGYRSSAKDTEFLLIDPTGSLGPHVFAAVESVQGWLQREKQHHTENLRQITTWERLGDDALSRGDRPGYRICQRAAVELETGGTVSSPTMAEVAVWLDALAAKGTAA